MIVVGIEEARTAAAERLVRDGVPPDQAETAARICLEAELWGRRTHGFIHLRRNLIQYHAADDRRGARQIVRETPVSALVDGGFHFSYTVHETATTLCIEKAQTSGLAIVGARNCGASGPLGREKVTPFIHEPSHFSGLYLAYRPDLFVDRADFDERVERLVGDLKSSQRAAGIAEIRLPGEASERRRAEALARGTVELEDATWEFLRE